MGKADQASSILLFFLGIYIAYHSYRFGLGQLARPGPGFVPFFCGAILSGLSVFVFLREELTHRSHGRMEIKQMWSGVNWHKPIYGMLAMLAYTLTFSHIGYLIPTVLLLIFLLKAIEPEKWLRSLMVAAGAAVMSYVLFAVWLQVQLPKGLLERFMFKG